jgi:nitrogen regulatory protein P-II 1
MKQITAIIQPQRLTRIREAARHLAKFPGMTTDKVEGFSVQEATPKASIKTELTEYSPKVRLVVLAPDEMVEPIVRMISGACHTGERGDGVVWVTPVESFERIRDGG